MDGNLPNTDQGRKTGTTTVGLICKDGVVLASDRRATMGYYIASKDVDKIYSLNDYMAMTIAGSVGDAQTLVRLMKAEVRLYEFKHGRKITVEAAATLLSNILAQYKFFPFFVQLLIGGVDEDSSLFSVDMLGGVTEEYIAATGSGSPIAMGVIEELYDKGESTEKNLQVAAKAVSAAMKRDAASGENVDLVMVDKKSGFKRIERDEVKKLVN